MCFSLAVSIPFLVYPFFLPSSVSFVGWVCLLGLVASAIGALGRLRESVPFRGRNLMESDGSLGDWDFPSLHKGQ